MAYFHGFEYTKRSPFVFSFVFSIQWLRKLLFLILPMVGFELKVSAFEEEHLCQLILSILLSFDLVFKVLLKEATTTSNSCFMAVISTHIAMKYYSDLCAAESLT